MKKVFFIFMIAFVGIVALLVHNEEKSEIFEILSSDEEGASWQHAESVILKISATGGKAECNLTISGVEETTSYKANLWLYSQNGDGSWTLLESWKNMLHTGLDFNVEKIFQSVQRGQTYLLYFTGKAFSTNGIGYDALAGKAVLRY